MAALADLASETAGNPVYVPLVSDSRIQLPCMAGTPQAIHMAAVTGSSIGHMWHEQPTAQLLLPCMHLLQEA